jgi:hypothetical protein
MSKEVRRLPKTKELIGDPNKNVGLPSVFVICYRVFGCFMFLDNTAHHPEETARTAPLSIQPQLLAPSCPPTGGIE